MEQNATEGIIAGPDADPGPGHADEPGRVRLRRHQRGFLPVPAGQGTAAERRLHSDAAGMLHGPSGRDKAAGDLLS